VPIGWIPSDGGPEAVFLAYNEMDLGAVIPARAVPSDFVIPPGTESRRVFASWVKDYQFYRTADLFPDANESERSAAAHGLLERSLARRPAFLSECDWPYVSDQMLERFELWKQRESEGWVGHDELCRMLGIENGARVDFSNCTEICEWSVRKLYRPVTVDEMAENGTLEPFIKLNFPKLSGFVLRCILSPRAHSSVLSSLMSAS